MTSYTLQVQPRRQYTLQYSNERGPQGPAGLGFTAIASGTILGNGLGDPSLPQALNASSVRSLLSLATFSEVAFAGLSFTGTGSAGLVLKSLTTAQITALDTASALPVGSILRDSTTDRIDARLTRGTVELLDTAGGQNVTGNLAATTLMVGGASGPQIQNSSGTFNFVNNAASAQAPVFAGAITCVGAIQNGPSTSSSTIVLRHDLNYLGLNADKRLVWSSATGTTNFFSGSVGLSLARVDATTAAFYTTATGTTTASLQIANLTASGSVFAAGSANVYSFSSTHPVSASPNTSWRFGSGWAGNYDTQFIFAYADNAAKVLIDTSGAITAFGGYYVNVPASSSNNIRPLQHGNSFLRFSAPASGIPGNNTTLEGWDSVFLNASTGNVRLRIGGVDRLVLTNTDLTLTGNLTASGTVRLGTFTVGTLPSAAANTRARAFVTDSNLSFNSTNLGATVTAGGSTLVPVFSNGTNWVIG